MLRADDWRAVVSELGELYQDRAARFGRATAVRWWRREWTRYAFGLCAEYVHRARHPGMPAVPVPSRLRIEIVNAVRDVRDAALGLVRAPALATTIVLTMGVALGAATSMFAVIDSVIIQPLPYERADEIYRIYTDSPPNRWPLSVADYRALNEQQRSFSTIAGYGLVTRTFEDGEAAERVDGKIVTPTYFSLLGLQPLHGTLFSAGDGAPGGEPKIVVSEGFWLRHLDGDPDAIGRQLHFDGQTFTLVGVLPAGVGPFETGRDFYVAVEWDAPPRKGPFFVVALARLKPGIEATTARDELRSINRSIFPIWQASYQDERASWGMQRAKDLIVGDVASTLFVLLTAVTFVLIIAATNAANLLFARATRRTRELAVRAALGAHPRRLVQQVLAESAALALAGAVLGLGLAAGSLRVVTRLGVDYIPRTQELTLDGASLWFAGALTVGVGLLLGLIPSIHAARLATASSLRGETRPATEGIAGRRIRDALVVAQFSVAVPLLVGSGLLVGTLVNLQRVDVGLVTDHLLTAAVSLPESRYEEPGSVAAFWTEIEQRLEALPGVTGVTFADGRPPGRVSMLNNFDLLDRRTPPGETQPVTPWVRVVPGYFDLLGIPLLEGRGFERTDDVGPAVAVVDEAWARRFYPGDTALGRRFYSGGSTTDPFTVIGVVGNVRHERLDQPDEGTVYWPMFQQDARFRFVMIRSGDAASVVPLLRSVVRDLDPGLALTDVATVDELLSRSLDTPRYVAGLVTTFAATALFLSLVGIHGLMTYFVQQRTREIGIRLALGGTRLQVSRMVLGRGMYLAGMGVLAGMVGAVVLTRYMSTLLYEVGATDPWTYVGAALLTLAVAMIVCMAAGSRAASIDPARTLTEV